MVVAIKTVTVVFMASFFTGLIMFSLFYIGQSIYKYLKSKL